MSASPNESRARAAVPAPPLPRPKLTIVPTAAAGARRAPFVATVIALLGAGLVGLLLLNTSMEQGAYTVTAQTKLSDTLAAEQQSLQLQVAALQDPQAVAQKALDLGMVQDPSPAFLSLATGKVIGWSAPGRAGDRFDLGTTGGPSVDRLGKIPPVAGGVASGSGPVVQRPATKPTKHQAGPKHPSSAG